MRSLKQLRYTVKSVSKYGSSKVRYSVRETFLQTWARQVQAAATVMPRDSQVDQEEEEVEPMKAQRGDVIANNLINAK
ncbi:hypothetical protein [Marinoscillum sp.]|uniref:hypothetical protein n=1 Tax=Marinoscillum sp. TaxID=2024838 RepID=UPI003BA8AA6D